jgi:hypothetical protein
MHEENNTSLHRSASSLIAQGKKALLLPCQSTGEGTGFVVLTHFRQISTRIPTCTIIVMKKYIKYF